MPLVLLQIVLAFAVDPGPARFGATVPQRVLDSGLTLMGPGQLSWRPLPLCAPKDQCWVEVAVSGTGRRVRMQLGGPAPLSALQHKDLAMARDEATTAVHERTSEWHFADGTVDTQRVLTFASDVEWRGEKYTAGEMLTEESEGLPRRCLSLLTLPRVQFERMGLLPPAGRLGQEVRAHLRRAAAALVELPGRRGAGDYARSGGVVTNLEFDTTLALLRLALALGDETLLLAARRSALHLCDRDIDSRTGLPFQHGPDHRINAPAPGHAWLQGLLWMGALCADERMLTVAAQIARGLASAPPMAQGSGERARDYAWPLLELESYLQLRPDPVVALAATEMALAIAARYRPELHTFCFGEGSFTEGDGYFERGWLSAGVVLPALRAHLARRPDPELRRAVDDVTAALLERIGQGRGGLPTHWRIVRGGTFAEHRAERDPKAFFMLEALPVADLRQLLQRSHVQRGLSETPALDDPDLATSFTMIARCAWVYR
jgi:hypothetical protein